MAKRRPQNQPQSTSPPSTGDGETTAPREPARAPEARPATPPAAAEREAVTPRETPPPVRPQPAPPVHRDPAPPRAPADGHGHAHHPAHGHAAHVDGATDDPEHHIIPVPLYIKIFLWLMVLLVLTLVAAIPDLGRLNLPIALSIAIAKTVLIMMFFMHLKFSSSLVRIFGTAAFLWLIILFVLTLNDYWSRHWLIIQ
jgi:cytochrome c oxidase subunit IV